MLFKLAFRNVKRQWRNYLIYFITVSLTIALIFALDNMIFGDSFKSLGDDFSDEFSAVWTVGLKSMLAVLLIVLSITTAFVLGYATSFLLRRRKKEFGLYLSMGMTRKNIIAIFSGEMTVTFLLSLGFGLLIGLGVFQVAFLILSNFLEISYQPAGYSLQGTIATVVIVGVIFLISSLFSLLYLRYVKIGALLQAEQIVEQTPKHPARWFVVSIVSLAVLIASLCFVVALFDNIKDTRFPKVLTYGIAVLFLSLVLFLFSLSKSLIPALLSRKRFAAKNIRTFTLRQISAKLTANSVMAGILAVLLSVVIIGSNVFAAIFGSFQRNEVISQPYSVTIEYRHDTPTDVMGDLNAFGELEGTCLVPFYTSYAIASENHPLMSKFAHNSDTVGCVVTESGFRDACGLLGYRPPALNGGFLLLFQNANPNLLSQVKKMKLKDEELKIGKTVYSCSGYFSSPVEMINGGYASNLLFVLPDDAPEILPDLTRMSVLQPVVYRNHEYDEEAMQEIRGDINNGGSNYYMDVRPRNSFHSTMLEIAAPFFLLDLFLSATFLLLSMAILALKVLTGISEERERFRTLWKLGASERSLNWSLFLQIFFYFFLPFGVPLFLNIPLSYVCSALSLVNGVFLYGVDLFGQLMTVTGLILSVYIPYFLVCYFLAKRDVEKSLYS